MSITEFDKFRFSLGCFVEYQKKVYRVISVDFEERLICIDYNEDERWIRCENCEIN